MLMRLSRGDLLASDLDEILQTVDSFEKFRDSRILILGGTGFVGTWIISAFLHANEVFNLNLSIHVITRDLASARSKLLFKIDDPVSLIEFNLKEPAYLLDNSFDFYIHAATPSLVATGSAEEDSVSSASFGGSNLISENIFTDCDYGVFLRGEATYIKRANVTNNYILNAATDGIQVVEVEESIITNNIVDSSSRYAIVLSGNYISAYNNIIKNCTGSYGFFLPAASYCKVKLKV